MFQTRSSGIWERNIIALRVVPAFAGGDVLELRCPRDAGWFVRRGARIAAVGLAQGCLTGDGEEILIRFIGAQSLAVPLDDAGKPLFEAATGFDHESVVLHGVADEVLRHANPLIVTVGGRTFELPFLRYRALSKGVGLRGIHLVLNGRFPYFSRYDQDWHVDLGDLLSVHGATRPLSLHELASVAEIIVPHSSQSPYEQAEAEALSVFALLLRTLGVMGCLTPGEFRRAANMLEEAQLT